MPNLTRKAADGEKDQKPREAGLMQCLPIIRCSCDRPELRRGPRKIDAHLAQPGIGRPKVSNTAFLLFPSLRLRQQELLSERNSRR